MAKTVLGKDNGSKAKLLLVIEGNRVDNEKFERVNQAFTYGIKLKNGQPEPRKLYQNLTKLVKNREQLGMSRTESLGILR